ncbi:MAG: MASE1 domain-containing protein [Elusimicrobia bacterium]|nr:MASE1 domain-containing protein [Elusimicrobiota bacterium]
MRTTDYSRAATITGLAAVYGLAAKVGLALAVVHPSVSAVWPPSAIALGALLVLGASCWPGVFAGAFLVNLHAALSRQEFGLAACLLSALGIAAGNTLEAVAGAWLVKRYAGGKTAVERAADLLKLAIFAGGLSTAISASVGVATLWAAGMLPSSAAGAAWTTWWLGDASGIIIGAPLLLAWCAAPPQKFKGGWAEAGALALMFGATLWIVFFRHSFPIAYLVLPGIVWASFRYGTRGSAAAVAVLTAAALAGTLNGRGPFGGERPGTDLLLLQGFLATTALSCYAMAALVWERERAESQLRHSRDRLEAEVDRRTRELVQAQKMEAVGRLSGAVAHEFNNVLTGVVGLASLIRNDAAAGSQTALDAADIVTASRRGGALAKRLLTMTRQGAEKKPLDLNEAVAANEKILRLAAGEKIALAFDLDPRAPAVLASADQLEQVLLNLCLNARDAMSGTGRITVSTRVQRVPKALILSHGALAAGDYAVLAVADTGAGIPEDIRSMIFEPFFSTKKNGQGTGLGLSIVYGIIADHKGAVDLVSRPGATEFRLYLPVTKRAPLPTPVPAAAPAPKRGTETILVADDDPAVRAIITRVLEPLGYRLLVAADGEEAWRLYGENAGKVAMAVLDVVMPRLKGDEVYARIAAKDPGFKVLFISGHATGQAEEAIRAGKHPLLPKPFALERIPAMVREILDRDR